MAEHFTLKGVERSYVLNFWSTNTFCRLEHATGRTYREVLENLASPRPQALFLRAFIKAALVDPPQATLQECGAIVDDIGGAGMIRKAIVPLLKPKRSRRGKRG